MVKHWKFILDIFWSMNVVVTCFSLFICLFLYFSFHWLKQEILIQCSAISFKLICRWGITYWWANRSVKLSFYPAFQVWQQKDNPFVSKYLCCRLVLANCTKNKICKYQQRWKRALTVISSIQSAPCRRWSHLLWPLWIRRIQLFIATILSGIKPALLSLPL